VEDPRYFLVILFAKNIQQMASNKNEIALELLQDKTVDLTAEIDSIELLKNSILLVSSRSVDQTQHKISIYDVLTGTLLAEFSSQRTRKEDAELRVKPIRLKYLPNSEKLVAVKGNEVRLLSATSNGSFLLDGVVNNHLPKNLNDIIAIELPFNEAQQIVKAAKNVLSKEESEIAKHNISIADIKDLLKQAENQIQNIVRAASNKHLQFPTVVVRAPYQNLKPLLSALVLQLAESDGFSASSQALETLRASGRTLNDPSIPKGQTLLPEDMNTEYNRLKSFAFWTKSKNPHVTPVSLVKAGFYHQPKFESNVQNLLVGQDRCVCFSCKLAVSEWDTKDTPWKEHSQLKPLCAFVQGKMTNNVPLAATLAGLPPGIHGDDEVKFIATSQHTDIILTASSDFMVTVWDSSVELKKLYTFDSHQGTVVTKKESKPKGTNVSLNSEFVLQSVWLLQCSPAPSQRKPEPATKQTKWIDWCTTDIEVYVTDKALYPGAKGVVFDIIDKDTICVFLTALTEVVNFPVAHLLPHRPKLGQKVKVLKGEHRGLDGILISVHDNMGIVRLDSTRKFISIEVASLASIPTPEGTIEKEVESVDIEDCCVLLMFASSNGGKILLYELTSKEPKYMQALPCDHKGIPILSEYVPSIKTLFVLFKREKATASDSKHVLTSFSFDPQNRRLQEAASIPILQSESDSFVKLICVDVEGMGEVLMCITASGKIRTFNLKTLDLLFTSNEISNENPLKDFVFISGDNQFVCSTSKGQLLSFQIPFRPPQTMTPEQRSAETVFLGDLSKLTIETLQNINKFTFENIEFTCFPPPGIKQVRVQDGTRVKWRLPQTDADERSNFVFEIEFPRTRTVDSLDLEIGLARAWLGIENEILGPKYAITLAYQDRTNNKWIKTLDNFDLTGIINYGDVEDPNRKLRAGSLNVNFTARRVLLTLHCLPREECTTKLIKRKKIDDDMKKGSSLKKMISKRFEYQSDFDENGLLYYIGTNGGKEEWKNPVATGKVKIEISHDKMYSQEMRKEDIIARTVTQSTYWGGSCPQWFQIDLGPEYRLLCDAYTLRHGYQHSNSYIQNWVFQGSNDAENWVTLHEGGETPFTKGFDVKTFHVKDGKEHFRYFRVLQKGNYSMGIGKPGGSPYICIAGFELYGELYIGASSRPTPNCVFTVAVRFSCVKPNPGMTLTETRLQRNTFYDATKLHVALIKVCEDSKAPLKLRHLCLDLLMDIWRRLTNEIEYIEKEMNLHNFLMLNLVNADKITAIKSGKLLLCALQRAPENFKRLLLLSLLDVLAKAVDCCRTPAAMNQMFILLYLCWDSDRNLAHANCVKLLADVGQKLYDNRSPFYNILRTHFGLYGCPLEPDLFETPERTEKQKKSEEPLATSAEALEQQLHIYSLEFSSKRRALTTLLEEINISGDSFVNHEKEVTKVYNECIVAQTMCHIIRKKLRKLTNSEATLSIEDCKLDRWTVFAERLFQLLNQQQLASDYTHEQTLLNNFFMHFCVYGTPTLRKEAARFLMQQLGSQISFPANTLRTFFSSNPEWKRPLNMFPQQEVFDTLQEIMGQDRLRFFYVDELFSMLEELTTASATPSAIDVPFVSWILLLLSNTMTLGAEKSPIHQGSKCRNCNMSPICGVRYRCVNCLDYDLCEQCESDSEAHNKNHLFLKIPMALTLTPSIRSSGPPPKDPLLPVLYSEPSSAVVNVPQSLNAAEDMEPETYVHNGVTCDGCGKCPIKGIRYKCVHCDEYNFCENCEGKVEHFPHHLFLKIRRPLPPSSSTENPKALIPLLLHRGFYPFSQYKSQTSPGSSKLSRSVTDASKMKKETDKELNPPVTTTTLRSLRASAADITKVTFINTNAESPQESSESTVFDGRHLRSIFSVISLAAKMQPLSPELFLLAIRVLEGLTNQYTPDDIFEDVFKHPKFDEFLSNVSSYPSTFIRSAVLQMVERLSNIETYNGGKECIHAIKKIRALLRSKAIALLNSEIEKVSIDFLLELLLVITTIKDVKEPTLSTPTVTTTTVTQEPQLNNEDVIETVMLANGPSPESILIGPPLVFLKPPTVKPSTSANTNVNTNTNTNTSTNININIINYGNTNDKSQGTSPTSNLTKVKRYIEDKNEFPLDEIGGFLLSYCVQRNPLTSSLAARVWCLVFRLLHFVDPKQLCRNPNLLPVIRQAILAPEELQALILDDFILLINKLLSQPTLSETLQTDLMGELVATFPQVHNDEQPRLYLRLVEVLREHFNDKVKFRFEHLCGLLQAFAVALPDPLTLRDPTENKLLQVVLEVLIQVFTSSSFTSVDRTKLLEFAKEKREKSFSQIFINWLSHIETQQTVLVDRNFAQTSDKSLSSNASISLSSSSTPALFLVPVSPSVTSTSFVPTSPISTSLNDNSSSVSQVSTAQPLDKLDLNKGLVKLIKILSADNEGAKHFLELSLAVLKNKPTSVAIAELCLLLVKNEELAYYFAIELAGANFLFEQIRTSNARTRSSFLMPAFATVLSHSAKKSSSSASTASSSSTSRVTLSSGAKSGDKLENLSSVSELLEPKQDKLLARLLKESTLVSACVWTYNFKKLKHQEEEKFTMTISIPDNVILREVRLDCINNYNSSSRFPSYVTIETGTSLSRLLPVGRFPCKTNVSSANLNTKFTATFKFPLPGSEVVKFIRIHLHSPTKSTWIALSRIQLLGHSSLLYNARDEGEWDPLLTAQLPLSTSLELLEHVLKYDKVQNHLAKDKETQSFALFLLNILTTKTNQSIQNILSYLSKYNVELSDMLLQQLLTGQTTCHASIAGRLCGLGDVGTISRLSKLRDFVFRELSSHNASSLSSHLMPFLNALSDAISSYQLKGMKVECTVTEEQIKLLFKCAVSAMEGSLMQQGSLRLLSALIQASATNFQVLLKEFEGSSEACPIEVAVLPSTNRAQSSSMNQNPFRIIGILGSSSSDCASRLLQTGIPERIISKIREYVMTKDKTKGKRADIEDATSSETFDDVQRFLEVSLSFLADVSHNNIMKNWLGKYAFELLFELCSRKDLGSTVLYAIQDVLRVCANLNTQNQEMIASYLLQQLKNPSLFVSEFMLQLMVDMFSLEDRVIVCLHSASGSSEEFNLLESANALPKAEPIRFSRKYCHPHLDLDDDGLGVTANANATTGWRTVLAEKPITSGVRKWEVILEKCTSTANIMIGVCEKNQKLNAYIGQSNTAKGWSYYGATTGYTYHDGKSNAQYGQKMKEGDIIGVTLDMDEGTLSFSRNGEDLGVAFSTGLLGHELYPAVSLYDVGDRVRIREVEGTNATKGVLAAAKLDSSMSPLVYQRSKPLFSLPANTTLGHIAESLISHDPDNLAVIFQLQGISEKKLLQATTTLAELHSLLNTDSELIDLTFEIVSKDDAGYSNLGIKGPIFSLQAIEETDSAMIGSVLKRFAEKDGLALLVDVIERYLEKLLAATTTGSLGLSSVTPPRESKDRNITQDKKKDREKELQMWQSWLTLLKMQLKIQGYVGLFVKDQDCRAMLFRVMNEVRIAKNSSNVREISEKLWLTNVPAPSDVLLSNPLQPLFTTLFDLFRSSHKETREKSLSLRTQVFESGVLAFLLSHLSELCDVMPRVPEYPTFVPVVKKLKERQRERQEQVAKQQNTTISGSDGRYWAKGTGYGTNADDNVQSSWSHEAYVKEQAALAKRIALLLEGVENYLIVEAEIVDNDIIPHEPQPSLPTLVYETIEASALLPVIESYLRNDSLLDMGRHMDLYTAILRTLRALVCHDTLLSFIAGSSQQSTPIVNLLTKLHAIADVTLKRIPTAKQSTTISTTTNTGNNNAIVLIKDNATTTSNAEDEVTLALEISKTHSLVTRRLESFRKIQEQKQLQQQSRPRDSKIDAPSSKHQTEGEIEFAKKYQEALAPHQFGEADMKDENGEYRHHFKTRIKTDTMPSPKKLKRLVQEISSLKSGLPLFAESSIFLRVDSERMDVLKIIITGPKDTPYDNGCFEFDVYCPPEYPATPPVVNLQTTGNGTVRFNPNLYNCGKVCLSLLGTWRGGPNEKWNENTSTLLQVFVSIQSLIFVEKPYFNEPGYESSMNTPKGEQQSRLYNEGIRCATIKWAMIEQLKAPTFGFEEAIRIHFKLKRYEIMQQCATWLKEAKESKTPGYYDKLLKLVEELKKELQNLDPSIPLQLPGTEEVVDNKKETEKELQRWEAAMSMQDLVPRFPLALFVKALELNQDKADPAVIWLFENGEAYLLDHPELFAQQPPDILKNKKKSEESENNQKTSSEEKTSEQKT